MSTFWRRVAIVVVFAGATAEIASLLTRTEVTPWLESRARIIVLPPQDAGAEAISDFAALEPDRLLTDRQWVHEVFRPEAKDKAPGANPADDTLCDFYVRKFDVRAADDAYWVWEVSCRAPLEVDCQTYLEVALAAYRVRINDEHVLPLSQVVDRLDTLRVKLADECTDRQHEYDEFCQQHPEWDAGRAQDEVASESLQRLAQAKTEALLRLTELESRLSNVEAAQDKGSSPTVLLDILLRRAIAGDDFAGIGLQGNGGGLADEATIADLQMQRKALTISLGAKHPRVREIDHQIAALSVASGPLARLLTKEKQLTERYGPGHPDVRAIKKLIAEYRKGGEPEEVTALSVPKPVLPDKMPGTAPEQVEVLLTALRQEVTTADHHYSELNGLFRDEKSRAAERVALREQGDRLRHAVDNTQAMLSETLETLKGARDTNRQPTWRCEIIDGPSSVVSVSSSDHGSILAGALVGALLGLAVVAALEFRSRHSEGKASA